MYGNGIKVYFVAFILSYSRMRFCYFSSQPVTTQILIKAHEYAFKYFGGAAKMLMYDQAKIMIYNETAGNIIFVKEFEEYVKHIGFAVYLCKKYDPCTKGKVENTVRVIKMSFLEGRKYCGISSLNSAALKWLDEFCNSTLNRHTLKTPQEMFEVERKRLLQTKAYINPTGKISSVAEGGTVMYKNSLYTLPRGRYEKSDKVRLQENADELNIYDADSNELVCSLPLSQDKGEIVREEQFQYSTDMQEQVIKLLNNDERLLKFLDGVRGEKPRFTHEQCALIRKINNNFTSQELFEAIEHCNNHSKFCATELIVYLVMKYGIERVAKIINYRTKYNYIERANKLQISLYGGEKNGRNNND